SQLGESLQLRRVQPAEGNLDALHAGRIPQRVGPLCAAGGIAEPLLRAAVMPLAVVIALSVGAAPEPCLGEDAIFDLALLLEGDFVLEDIEFGGQMRRHLASKMGLPLGIACFHIPYTTSEWGLLGQAAVGPRGGEPASWRACLGA